AAERRQHGEAGPAQGLFVLLDPRVLGSPGRQVVPLVTGDLARLAADTDRRVSEEAYGFGHGSIPRLAAAPPTPPPPPPASRGPPRAARARARGPAARR